MNKIISIMRDCRTIGDVASNLPPLLNQFANAQERAAFFYINSWIDHFSPSHPFSIKKFISDDLSGIMYANIPIIFMGTNCWAEKQYLSEDILWLYFEKWRNHVINAISSIEKPVFLVVVPEKDVIIKRIVGGMVAGDGKCEATIERFLADFRGLVCGSSFMDCSLGAEDKDVADYSYYDSHLLTKDYISIFSEIMRGFALTNPSITSDLGVENDILWGDLDFKLDNPNRKGDFQYPKIANRVVTQVAGKPTFSDPLRDTWQSFRCENAPLKGKVVIFGDSHSSIYSQRKLTYLLANTFEFCDFYWDSLCMSGRFDKFSGADYIVLEISERFLFS